MPRPELSDVLISGIGVTSAIGQGARAFSDALLQGRSGFKVMTRPGRQYVVPAAGNGTEPGNSSAFLGAEIGELSVPQAIKRGMLRTASFSGQVALATIHEAWQDAKLDQVDPLRIGLVVGGSNFQQRDVLLLQEASRHRPHFLRPTYGMSFMDSDVCGLCTEQFGIGGLTCTVGGASASGQLAVIQAIQAVLSAQVDVCIAVGALMDLSYWECQGLRSLGAMGSDRFAAEPARACRPFDRDRDGFIYGECCGALVIELADSAIRRGTGAHACISGWSIHMARNRNPDPSLVGEVYVMRGSMEQAGLQASDIDYVNPHGTGSIIGDQTELLALRECGLGHAHLNSTKSITGHGLSAAGAVELIATIVQMKENRLHPTLNLERAIDEDYAWVGQQGRDHTIERALNLSFGFGGVSTAVCIERL